TFAGFGRSRYDPVRHEMPLCVRGPTENAGFRSPGKYEQSRMSSESISQPSATSRDQPLSPDDVARYDYELPEELIAKEPLPERDASRLPVLDRHSGQTQHHPTPTLPDFA